MRNRQKKRKTEIIERQKEKETARPERRDKGMEKEQD